MRVTAEFNTKDHCQLAFDVTQWFEQASDDEILALIKDKWTGQRADLILAHMVEQNRKLQKVSKQKPEDSKIIVNERQAMKWIGEYREYLLDQIGEKT